MAKSHKTLLLTISGTVVISAIIVASAGNDGESALSYPAAYSGVISVGAIEVTGEHLDFSNTGQNLSLSAPGFEVSAAWGENQRIGFSGTSASAPFVSGALAAVLSERPELSNQQAIELLQNNANEAGAVGADAYYGVGTLDLGRALESGQPDIYDAAVSSQFFEISENGTEELVIVVQNQGTETLFNSPLNIRTPLGTTNVSINSLLPGDTFTQRLPFDTSKPQGSFTIQTEIQSTTSEDNDLSNNTKQSTFETTEE